MDKHSMYLERDSVSRIGEAGINTLCIFATALESQFEESTKHFSTRAMRPPLSASRCGHCEPRKLCFVSLEVSR